MIHTLPKSGFTLEINEQPLSGALEDLNDFFENMTTQTVDGEGKSIGTFVKPVGVVKREYITLRKITFIKSIKDKDGKELPLTKETLRSLPNEDGELLGELTLNALESLKKK
jgi:hypothetical protein